MAKLAVNKSKTKADPLVTFTITVKTSVLLSTVIEEATNFELPAFKGRTDQDLVKYLRDYINKVYGGDPDIFIDEWSLLFDSQLIDLDIKLEK